MGRQILRHTFVGALAAALFFARGAGAQGQSPSDAADVPVAPGAEAAEEDGPILEALKFDAAITRALARNPTALEAAAEIRRYHALREEVRAASLPTVSGVGTYTRLEGNRFAGTSLVASDSSVNVSATVSIPLVNVKSWREWQQASDALDAARASAEDVRRTVGIATARAYLSVLTQKRLLETAVIARDNARAHYDFTRAQRVGGVGNRLDEARAAQELTTEEVLLQNQEAALFHAREALGVFVVGDGAVDATEWTFGEPPTLGDAMREAEGRRADVRARERAAQAADRRVDQAYADYLPYLSFVGSPFYESVPVPSLPQTGWQAQLALTVPLYDGGLRYGQEHERKALADEAHLGVEATVRQARSDVRAAFEEMKRADLAFRQAQQSSAFATRVWNLANLAYKGGATSNLEVIDAERQERDAQTQAVIAEDAARGARLDVLAAAGRFP
jgi:outer membrane protein TolC